MGLKVIYWNPISGSYFLYGSILGKSLEQRPFFWVDMARLGKYCTGGYGWIGVIKVLEPCHENFDPTLNYFPYP